MSNSDDQKISDLPRIDRAFLYFIANIPIWIAYSYTKMMLFFLTSDILSIIFGITLCLSLISLVGGVVNFIGWCYDVDGYMRSGK